MEEGKIYACFAANNPFKLTTACSFETEEMAETFKNDIFPTARRPSLSVSEIETESDFPSVVELIKSGYGDYTFDMFDGMFEDDCVIH